MQRSIWLKGLNACRALHIYLRKEWRGREEGVLIAAPLEIILVNSYSEIIKLHLY